MIGDDELSRSSEPLAAAEFIGDDPYAIHYPYEQAKGALDEAAHASATAHRAARQQHRCRENKQT
jgi:hypothetical protein